MDERWNSILTLAEEWAAAAAMSVIKPDAIQKSWDAADAFVTAVEDLRAAVEGHEDHTWVSEYEYQCRRRRTPEKR